MRGNVCAIFRERTCVHVREKRETESERGSQSIVVGFICIYKIVEAVALLGAKRVGVLEYHRILSMLVNIIILYFCVFQVNQIQC